VTEREIALCDWLDERDRAVDAIEDPHARVRERARMLAEFIVRGVTLWQTYAANCWPAWARGIVDAANRWWRVMREEMPSCEELDRLRDRLREVLL